MIHPNRSLALAGAVAAIVGLVLKGARTDGEEIMPALASAVPDFPDGIPTLFGGLDTWEQWAVAILIGVVLVLVLKPVISAAIDKTSSMAIGAAGIGLFVAGIIKWIDATNRASDVEDAFAALNAAGQVPVPFEVSVIPLGYILFLLGMGAVAIAGTLSLKDR